MKDKRGNKKRYVWPEKKLLPPLIRALKRNRFRYERRRSVLYSYLCGYSFLSGSLIFELAIDFHAPMTARIFVLSSDSIVIRYMRIRVGELSQFTVNDWLKPTLDDLTVIAMTERVLRG